MSGSKTISSLFSCLSGFLRAGPFFICLFCLSCTPSSTEHPLLKECREDQSLTLRRLRPELPEEIFEKSATRFCDCLFKSIAGHPDYPAFMARVEKGEGLKALHNFSEFSDLILQKCAQ